MYSGGQFVSELSIAGYSQRQQTTHKHTTTSCRPIHVVQAVALFMYFKNRNKW